MLSYRCNRDDHVLLRFTAENMALTSFDLFQIQPNGDRRHLWTDPDIDGTGAYVMTPHAGGPPLAALALLVKPAAINKGRVPIRLALEQSGARLQPIGEVATPPNAHGDLLGQPQSGTFAELRFGLFFTA